MVLSRTSALWKQGPHPVVVRSAWIEQGGRLGSNNPKVDSFSVDRNRAIRKDRCGATYFRCFCVS